MPKPYSEKLRDPRWERVKLQIKQAANWRCEDCSAHDKPLEVHHTAYIANRDPWDYPTDLLMCVCTDCHKWRQGREEAFRVALGKITRFLPPAQLEGEVWAILKEIYNREGERLTDSFT